MTAAGGRQITVGPPDEENTLVPVPAEELFGWARLLGVLADGLDQAAETTRHDLRRRLPDHLAAGDLATALDQVSERIGALCGGTGWWPR